MTPPTTRTPIPEDPAPTRERRRVRVTGVVQGVGFRPFVYTLAAELGLTGWVLNDPAGVEAEIQGPPAAVAGFLTRLRADAPPLAVIESLAHHAVPLTAEAGFTIRPSDPAATGRTLVPPDTAVCESCLHEVADPTDRRYRHPFATCTHCGPRFTIVTALPYDRAATTMSGFPMCPDCTGEYQDPDDRRFHAQPVACPRCGPRLAFLAAGDRREGAELRDAQALAAARQLILSGAVLAVKGIGGYHLACDAGNPAAVRALRARKNRGGKPFAVLAESLAVAERLAHVGPEERALLRGPRKPVVLLRRRREPGNAAAALVAQEVAPGSPDLGVMLPYSPLHRLLLGLPEDPPGPAVLVMTSANRSGEPIVTDDGEALERLRGLADGWLLHDRPIHVPCDDSVVRVCAGAELPVRRSRGYAPFPVALPLPVEPVLAVGGDLKNTFCVAEGRYAWLSAHVGDMDDLATLTAFDGATEHLQRLTSVRPALLVADHHPGYRSTRWARRAAAGRPVRTVQHHHAHVASVMAEHGLDGTSPVLGVAFDGTGYGDDGAVWGGEFLIADYDGYQRFAHVAYVPLPGGDAAVRNPYRMALSHLRAAGLPWAPELPCTMAAAPGELRLLRTQLERGLHCVPTSSMGRLFDAVSSLAGICHRVRYEAQAAMELENEAVAAIEESGGTPGRPSVEMRSGGYRFTLEPRPEGDQKPLVADPAPVLADAVRDLRAGCPPSVVAVRFHEAVAQLVRDVSVAARERTGVRTVALTGGVFCNAVLTERCTGALEQDGFTVLRHRKVPPNDGGLALGQVMIAARLPGGPGRAGN